MAKGKGSFRVEFLRDLLTEGEMVKANFFMETDQLKPYEATFFITVKQEGKLDQHEFSWEPEVEEYFLFENPTKMNNREEEVLRFANILINNIKTAEMTWGKDYVHAVIVQYLSEHNEYNLKQLLDRISISRPHNESSPSYNDCRNFIQHAIQGLQNTSIVSLGYPNDETSIQLIAESIAMALDFKFHLSLRNLLFPE